MVMLVRTRADGFRGGTPHRRGFNRPPSLTANHTVGALIESSVGGVPWWLPWSLWG